jgi:hypothetical protein
MIVKASRAEINFIENLCFSLPNRNLRRRENTLQLFLKISSVSNAEAEVVSLSDICKEASSFGSGIDFPLRERFRCLTFYVKTIEK